MVLSSKFAARRCCRLSTGQTDGQTDGRTDTRPFHRPRSTGYAGNANKAIVNIGLHRWSDAARLPSHSEYNGLLAIALPGRLLAHKASSAEPEVRHLSLDFITSNFPGTE